MKLTFVRRGPQVETTSVAAGVVLSNGLVRQSVDFGNVPVDQTREVVVAVQSRLALPAHLALEPLCCQAELLQQHNRRAYKIISRPEEVPYP